MTIKSEASYCTTERPNDKIFYMLIKSVSFFICLGLHLVIAHFKKLAEQNFFYQRCLYNNALCLKNQN